MRKLSIREWAREDRPREKLLLQGPQHLSNAELLAILIQNGTRENSALDVAKNMLLYAHNDLNQLAGMSVQELVNGRIAGLGTAKAVMIAAAMELGVRRKAAGHFRIKIQSSKDVANYLQAQLEHRKQEIFAVVYLNRGNRILSLETISIGGLTGTVADPRIILKKALEQDATALVLCHNHPSGNLTPSRADEQLTQKIKQAAALMDIQVLDHIIVSHEGYFSFADEGMI
ncbi:MAG: DNA repair protein RadC [Chitinophagaceae bacterium]|jgi:DNA repair protein RadC|nr:DNA repair protein RadC [Chitinophagaceae bacterium]MCE2974562.1 DNA repair protein RadC [Sediminibacterium sp.]MCA6469787.1 DNA repair protein RadC [Chitinophagaceae bacterium]MCA6472373.1 DNA repair protein RadC [Chitinophagaceae bacterium]MCA6475517.1 DNA repair protein RadC [Chitinophagaceae bacterium]